MSGVVEVLGRRHRLLHECSQRGTTLIELVVAMVLMVIFGSIFTGSVVSMNRAAVASQAVTNSSDQINRAYLRLDKLVRYASAVSAPAITASSTKNWYVELRTTAGGTPVCTQLRVDKTTQQLQQRTWTDTATITPSAWVPLASGVTNANATSDSDDRPFVLLPEQSTVNFQQLRINLATISGDNSQTQTKATRSTFTFTAINSTQPPSSTDICQRAGRP